MNVTISTRAGPELVQRWRQQVASQRRRRERRGPRPCAALSYLVRGPVLNGLIDVRRLVFVVARAQRRHDDGLATRVLGYAAAATPWGVRIGGADNCRFEKELTLAPRAEARGRRIDLHDEELLHLALDLDRFLERQERYPYLPGRRQPRWPNLWAAFQPEVARHIECAGPEFERACQGASLVCGVAFQRSAWGLTLFPLELVSHAWRQFTAVLADTRTVPKRQVMALDHPARDLCGFTGAIEYDLCHSRFSPASLP